MDRRWPRRPSRLPLLVHEIARRTSPGCAPCRSATCWTHSSPGGRHLRDGPARRSRSRTRTCAMRRSPPACPLSIVRKQTLGLFPPAFRMMGRFLEVQSPWRTRGVRTVTSTTPAASASGSTAAAATSASSCPAIIRPRTSCGCGAGDEGAGRPAPVDRRSVHAVPTGHRRSSKPGCPRMPSRSCLAATTWSMPIVQSCSLSVLFGGQQLADRYASNRNVRIHGPGRSKVVVLADADFDQTVTPDLAPGHG